MKKLAVFASGRGSNFEAISVNIKKGIIHAEIVLLVSDNVDAPVLACAKKAGIKTFAFNPREFKNKRAYEEKIVALLESEAVNIIVLAGYMRIIGPTILEAYPRKILNIHPSLLPSFKGKDAIQQAWDSKACETGVTVHYVDEKIDHGEIITQEALKITHHTVALLEEDIHAIEHRLYTKAINKVLEGII